MAKVRGDDALNKRLTPFSIMVGNGVLHCGSGCTLGDIAAEWLTIAFKQLALVPIQDCAGARS